MQTKNKIIKWECPHCEDKKESHSQEHHKMDTCKCGKSSVDLEEHYCRVVGNAKILKKVKGD